MSVYKNLETKKWEAEICTTIDGKRIRKKKCGFETKREAIEWTRTYINDLSYSLNISMSSLLDKYIEDKKPRWKIKTILQRENLIKNHLKPFFGDMILSEVDTRCIVKLQNNLLDIGVSGSTILSIEKLLSSLFKHIAMYYNIQHNPMIRVEKVGKRNKLENDRVWTEEQFDEFIVFIGTIENSQVNKSGLIAILTTLFYTGMRVGELLALTWKDINLTTGYISVSKTLFRHGGNDIVGSPKTDSSDRKIKIHSKLVELLISYKNSIYGVSNTQRAFSFINGSTLSHSFSNWTKKTELPHIRLHDLRHSHATMLLSKGAPISAISKRLGHSNISITLNVYSHVLKSDEDKLMSILDE